MTKKRLFSGIQPSGRLHLGNYLGAIEQFKQMQDDFESIFCIVDLHAITVSQNPKELKENVYSLAAWYLACGIDPEKSTLFVQSHIKEHSELAWLLNTITYMGELQRMTQFKNKTEDKESNNVGVGLFDYPVLMAADILLYQTDIVPVGHDQKQHLELTRNLAQRFNNKFGKVFKVPEVKIKKTGARIMALDEPTKKMSKSSPSINSYILLSDNEKTISKKISRAVTDSENKITFNKNRAGIYNLLTIYENLSGLSEVEIENNFKQKGYGDFKKELANLIIKNIKPIQEKYQKIQKDRAYLDQILNKGKDNILPIAQTTIKNVKNKMGL